MEHHADQAATRPINFQDPHSSNKQQHRFQRANIHEHVLTADDTRTTKILFPSQQPRTNAELDRTAATQLPSQSNHRHVRDEIKIQCRQRAFQPNLCTGIKGKKPTISDTKHGGLEGANRQNGNAVMDGFDSGSLEKLRLALAKVSIKSEQQQEQEQKNALCEAISKRLDLLASVHLSVRIAEPLAVVHISGFINNSDDLDFLFRFRAQKKIEPFSCINAVIDLSDLQFSCDLSGFLSRWALFILSRCSSFAIVNPRDAKTSQTVHFAVQCFNSNPEAQPVQILNRPIKISVVESPENS